MSQCYVIKQIMVNAIAYIIELWMHLGGWLSTQEAKSHTRLSPRATLTPFFCAQQPPLCIHNPVVPAMICTICLLLHFSLDLPTNGCMKFALHFADLI